MGKKKPALVSYEFFRRMQKKLDKFDTKKAMLGELHAIQSVRETGRLHTYAPGERSEYDYTKFGLWLYPNEHWPEPMFYYTGFGVDHESRVIKGFTTTVAPAARDMVRLYRNSTMPNLLWLPEYLRPKAQHWDVHGIDAISVVDNAADLTADAISFMYYFLGVILLRMPPLRGDLKGTVERTQSSMESMFISSLPGYVAHTYLGKNEHGVFSPQYKKVREKAKAKANLTVADYEAKLLDSLLAYNHKSHPQFGKPRIQVWRDGQELAPLILPTGDLQIRSIFALTYETTLTREGVEVEALKFNSPELHERYLTHSGKVHVKLNPDDISSVLVFVPQFDLPVEAHLTTFDLPIPMTLELLKVLLARLAARYGNDEAWKEDLGFAVLDELQRVQSGCVKRTPGKTMRADAQAATHAAAAAPALPTHKPATEGLSLSELLRGRKSDDK